MRVNVYAEEMTDQIEIIEKEIGGQKFTGLRIYLHLPVTVGGQGRHVSAEGPQVYPPTNGRPAQVRGPFMHHPGDDDSSAVTFWGKWDLREALKKALTLLDEYYRPLEAIEKWNRVVRAGDAIWYRPGRESAPRRAEARSAAWLYRGTPCVMILEEAGQGPPRTGCVPLEYCDAIREQKEELPK